MSKILHIYEQNPFPNRNSPLRAILFIHVLHSYTDCWKKGLAVIFSLIYILFNEAEFVEMVINLSDVLLII